MFNMRRVTHSIRPMHQPRMPWSRGNSVIDGTFGFAATVLMVRLATPVYQESER